MEGDNKILNLSEHEAFQEKVSQLSTNYIESLRKEITINSVHKDENTGHYRLTSDSRENAHITFDTFFEQAERNHQLLRLAVDSAYTKIKSEIQQDQDEEKLSEQGWVLLRTVQSIQGVNTWQEANELYQRRTGLTAKEQGISAAQLYQRAKEIRIQLESKGISVDEYLRRDVIEFDKTLTEEAENLDIETATLLGKARKKIEEFKQKIAGWLPKKQKDRQPEVITDDVASEEEVPSILRERMTRRQFLGFVGGVGGAIGASAILGPTIKVVLDPEFRAGGRAALTRPEIPGSGEKQEASLSTLLEVYRKHFKEKEHLFPEKVWVRTEETPQGEVLRGTGTHLAILAQNCYKAEKKDGENFDAYYVRFVDSLHEMSDMANLDFITLVTSLQISAENLGGYEEPKGASNIDIAISRVQKVGVTAARALGLESVMMESLGPRGLASQIRNEAERRGITTPLEGAIPEGGLRHYDLIRFREQPTTGLMDFEPGNRAEAFISFQDNPVSDMLRREYPEVCENYVKTHERREEVSVTRREMESAANGFIERFGDALRPFAEGDEEALNAIGISPNMDLWQLINYTDVWYKVSEIPTNPEFAYQRTVEYMKQEAEKDPQAFYRRLFSQQIRNPKFLNYLMRHSITSSNHEESLAVLDIQDLVGRYEQKAKDLRIAHLNILEAEGRHEYDSRFQQATSVLVTKQLSDAAGTFDPNERNSLGWHIYKTCAAREIAPIPFLVDEQPYACDITIDPPYAVEATVKSLDTFARMLQETGILETTPVEDINAFYSTMEKMFWRDGGVWFGAEPNQEDQAKWNRILEHFNTKLANRLFYDFAGLLHNEQKMGELNEIMMSKGLISERANEDPYNFFTQFVYLALDSKHMRRDISETDWNDAQRYFQENIMPMVITREEISPGVFREKWNIGSADYPPIFRSQAVMYNFLIDQNPEQPSSTLSSDIMGSLIFSNRTLQR